MEANLREKEWRRLLERIDAGRCTPFLGAGACFGVLPLASDMAREWAAEYKYPLGDKPDLARVAQFLAVTEDHVHPKEKIQRMFRKLKPPDFNDATEPHRVLADLPLPVYITTNYDDFMMQALRRTGAKKPRQELCRWNRFLEDEPSVFEREPNFDPDPSNPIVFHLHGSQGLPESMVLTEDDYLDFLVKVAQDPDLLPARIRRAFTSASLLFLGYGIGDWNFRVLFRSLVTYLEKSLKRDHVSVQLVPSWDGASDEQREAVRAYLDSYYQELDIHMYWGTCRDFVKELRGRWDEYQRSKS